jgi:hypothetical protein
VEGTYIKKVNYYIKSVETGKNDKIIEDASILSVHGLLMGDKEHEV